MAEINSLAYQHGPHVHPVSDISRVYRHLLSAEPSAADEINFFKLPKGVKCLDALLAGDRLDTGVAAIDVSLVLSDGTTTLTLVSAFTGLSSATAANRIARNQNPDLFGFVTDTHDYRLYVLYNTVAGTFAAGDLVAGISYNVHDVHQGA